jgi:hypothetical protein
VTRQDKIALGTLAVVAVVLPLAFGASFHWPDWVSLVFAVVLLASIVLVGRLLAHARQQRFLLAQYGSQVATKSDHPADTQQIGQSADHAENSRPAPPTERRYSIVGARLPSTDRDYPFVFSATVCWNPAPNQIGIRHTNPEALAVDAILDRAIDVTAGRPPTDYVVVGHRLAATLGTMLPDRTGQVVAWADAIGLALPDGDQERLHAIAELRKQEQVWDHERAFERSVRAYLTTEVLVNPGSAVVWWLSRHIDQVEETARLIGPLTQLTVAASNTTSPEALQRMVAEHREIGNGDQTNQDRPQWTEPGRQQEG